MSSALHSHTPALTALDSRGLAVRSIRWYRAEDGAEAEARVTHSRLDSMGRIVEQRDARLFASSAVRPNLATLYSLSGNVLLSDSVDAGVQVLLHCEDGLADERRDGRGTRTRYEYDGLRRVIGVYESSSDEPERCAERFLYGDELADSSYNLRQQMLRHDDPAGTRHMHAYDLKGLPQQERQHFLDSLESPDWPDDPAARDALQEPGDGMLSQWEYSPWGEQLGMTDAAGNQHRQRFDIAGHLAVSTLQPAEQETPTTLVEQVHYNAFDQVQSQVAGNGLITETSYDPADGRLSRLLCRPANDAQALQDISYFYDPAGNVVRHEDATIASRYHGNRRIDPVSEFSYDSLYQLIEASGRERIGAGRGPELPGVIDFSGNDESLIGTYTRRYQYDAGGNLLLMQHQGQNGQAHTLRMAVSGTSNKSIPWREGLSDEQIENTFDANGNLCQLQPGQKMDWDLRNQLSQVSLVERENNQNDTERYIYGGGGKRLRKYANRQASGVMHHTETRYLPGLELHEDSATGQRCHVVNINAGRGKIRWMHWFSTPPAGLPENSLYYGFDNQLGSVTLETDEHGQVASREEYYPFGGTALIASRNEVEVSFKTLRYSGKERDATGLYYYGYRYLAPWLCRWLNPDPAGTVDGLNLFGFVGNNPLTWVDGDGRIRVRNPFEDDYDPNAEVAGPAPGAASNINAGPPPRPESTLSVASVNSALFDSPPGSVDTALFDSPPGSVDTALFDSPPGSVDTALFDSPPGSVDTALFDSPPGSVDRALFDSRPASSAPSHDAEGFRIPAPRPAIAGPSSATPGSSQMGRNNVPVGSVALGELRPVVQSRPVGRPAGTSRNSSNTGEGRVCPTCGKGFSDPYNLKYHINAVHLKIKPYACTMCSYQSAYKSLLKYHMKHHMKHQMSEKPYRCDICYKSFLSPLTIMRHVTDAHTDGQRVACEQCGKSFKNRSSLKTHQRTQHSGGSR